MRNNYCSVAVCLALSTSFLSFTTLAEDNKLKEYPLDLKTICAMQVTPEGDVYALGYASDNDYSLAYTVLKNDLKTTFKGEIHTPTGGRASCSSSEKIIPGEHDDFTVPTNWIITHHDADYESATYIYQVNYKQNQHDVLLSKEKVHLDKLFFDKTKSILYATTYATWSQNRQHTTVTAVDVNTRTPLWSKDFLHASRGSVVSPDHSKLYLIGEKKSELVSLTDHSVISEGPSVVNGFYAKTDDQGNVYSGRIDGGERQVFAAQLQPFTSPADPVRWQIPYSSQLRPEILDGYAIAPDGSLYVSSKASVAGASIMQIDASSGRLRASIYPPVNADGDQLAFIAPAVFDKESGMGYSYSSLLVEGYPEQVKDYIRRYDIWGFSADTYQSKALFTLKTDDGVPRGFTLAHNRIYLAMKDTLYVYDLNLTDDGQNNLGVQHDGPTNFTRDEADQGITIQYQAPPATEGRNDYYLFSLNEEGTRFGSYQKIKAGSKGVAKVKIHKIWHPQGGKFTIGLTDNVNRPATAKPLGDAVSVTVTP